MAARFNQPRTVVLKCLACSFFVKQEVAAFARAHDVLCPVCEIKLGNWFGREMLKREASVCDACGNAPVVLSQHVEGLHGTRWLHLCAVCTGRWRG